MRLSEPCALCGSMSWCGRQCKSAPRRLAARVVVPEAVKPEPVVVVPEVIVEAPVVAAAGCVVEGRCETCGGRMLATKRRRFCSDRCRVVAHRKRRRS